MTPQDFLAAGFQRCPSPPACWAHDAGTVYVRPHAHGAAYVRYVDEQKDEVEAFVGDWQQPWLYWFCRGCRVTLRQILRRLG